MCKMGTPDGPRGGITQLGCLLLLDWEIPGLGLLLLLGGGTQSSLLLCYSLILESQTSSPSYLSPEISFVSLSAAPFPTSMVNLVGRIRGKGSTLEVSSQNFNQEVPERPPLCSRTLPHLVELQVPKVSALMSSLCSSIIFLGICHKYAYERY